MGTFALFLENHLEPARVFNVKGRVNDGEFR